MSTISFGPTGIAYPQPGGHSAFACLRRPLDQWHRRERRTVAFLVALAGFAAGANAWMSADLAGLGASRIALDGARQRVAHAREALAQLPRLRQRAATAGRAAAPRTWSAADELGAVSMLASRSGVTLLSLTPGATGGSGLDARRTLHLGAQTDFAHLRTFVGGLADLPVLAVPEEIVVKRSGARLAVNATLYVFDALGPAPAARALRSGAQRALDEADAEPEDPFSAAPDVRIEANDAGPDLLRLVGVLKDRAHGLALLETGDGAIAAARGERVGDEVVAQIEAQGITLENPLGARTLDLADPAEDAR